MKFENNLNDYFNIYRTNVTPKNIFMLKARKDIREYRIMGQFLTGVSSVDEDMTDKNSIFVLDEISVDNKTYLVIGVSKDTDDIYEIEVTEKLDHKVVSNSPISKIIYQDEIDNHLKKLIYDNYNGSSDYFDEVYEIVKKAFSIGLNANLIRNLSNYDTNMVKVNENDGGISVGFKS